MNRTSSACSSVGIRAIPRLRRAEQHVQKISRIAQLVVGINERHPQRMAIRKRRDRRHFSDQAIRLFLARFLAEDIFRVVIVGRERRNRRNQHAHRMGIVMKAVEKFLDAFMNERVMRDVVGPILQLLRVRQLAVQKQVGGFEVGAFLGQIFDGIAAIAQDARVAIDVSHSADARCRVVERRIVAHHPEIGVFYLDLAQIHGADRAIRDGHFVALAGAIVRDCKRFPRLGRCVSLSRLPVASMLGSP